MRCDVSVGLSCFPGVGTQRGRAAYQRLTDLSLSLPLSHVLSLSLSLSVHERTSRFFQKNSVLLLRLRWLSHTKYAFHLARVKRLLIRSMQE